VGTVPDISYDAIEKVAGLPIHWVAPDDVSVKWSDFATEVPYVFVVSGWATPAFNELGRQVRKNGGAVIAMIDNRWRGDLRQRLAPIVFKTKYHGWFRAAIVPGKSARRFVRHLGIPDSAIYEGLYSGNPSIFVPGPPLSERPRRFLFIGRFVERKGIRELAEAWSTVQPQLPGWELHAVGEGDLQPILESTPGVVVHPFKQLQELADFYRQSRFLVLPSYEDHWGVVVHEAARCGCGLLLSENVGARDDLANAINSFSFTPGRPSALADAMLRAAQLDEPQLRAVYHESLALAYRFGPHVFADAVHKAVAGLNVRGC
jgi:glycosyltransferase involved in cell wall biosynthesis